PSRDGWAVRGGGAAMRARAEPARAAGWGAARAARDVDNGGGLAIAAAAALAFEAAFLNGKDCVQTLAGIGFTWEHDAHLYLRRSITQRQLAGTPDEWRVRAAREVQGGARRRLAVDLGPEAEAHRVEVRALLAEVTALSTRATRVEGGWVLNGQKVWTSLARFADWGICLARSAPDRPKHEGISCFMVDMKTPGIDVRPLRELTGNETFNEVFFDDVFVPEDCLVGAEHDGWRCARTTLANERVYMGGSNTIGGGVVGALRAIEARGLADDRLALAEVGDLVATGHALSALGFRLTLAALAGADPSGSDAAVRKLLGVEQDQRVQEGGMLVPG